MGFLSLPISLSHALVRRVAASRAGILELRRGLEDVFKLTKVRLDFGDQSDTFQEAERCVCSIVLF